MKTTVVGSFPIPPWLMSHPTKETLEDAVRIVMDLQAGTGVEVISDGEISRWDVAGGSSRGMVERFTNRMVGINPVLTRSQQAMFQEQSGMSYRKKPAGVVVGPINEGSLNLMRDWQKIRSLTRCPLKLTITSPYLMARALVDDYYESFENVLKALADVMRSQLIGIDADVIQIDEPRLPGHPDDSEMAAAAINRVLEGVDAAREKAVHLCFGNYGGQKIQTGSYTALIDFMNVLACDHIVLETTRRPGDELKRLSEVRKTTRFGVGVVDVKDLQIETPDQVARRIEQIAKWIGEARIAYVNPDCGLRMLPREVAVGKLKALAAGRNLYLEKS